MPGKLASDLITFISANPGYHTWDELPDELLARAARSRPETVVRAAVDVWKRGDHKSLWAASTLLNSRPEVLKLVRWRVLEEMAGTMGSWWSVDAFASLSGPAWREGRLSDARVDRWTRSKNRWLRRASLVSTVYLNRRCRGGEGDVERTLRVCRALVADRDDMVVKAMSWALRELISVDRAAVKRFLREYGDELGALARREVRNKLETGLKNPRKRR